MTPVPYGTEPAVQRPSPEYGAGVLSRILFTWMTPLFAVGNARPLVESDIYGVAGDDAPAKVAAEFEVLLHTSLASGQPHATYRALVRQFWWPMVIAGVFKFINSTLNFAPLILLYYLLENIAARSAGSTTATAGTGYILAAAMFVAIVARTLNENWYFASVIRVGFRIRAALTAAVYRKALRMTPAARSETPTGQVVNLMQIDASRIDTLMMQLHVLWDSPFQILGYMILLGVFIGISALAGLATMVILIPLQGWMMAAMGRHRRTVTKANDVRIKLTNEALQGIRAAKLYSWEGPIAAAIGRARDAELTAIQSYSILQSVNVTLMTVSPIVVAVVTLLVYAYTPNTTFTAARVFSALSVLTSLRLPLLFFPSVIAQVADARVSLERLDRFFRQPEVEQYCIKDADIAVTIAERSTNADAPAPPVSAPEDKRVENVERPAIVISRATFFWEHPSARAERLERKAAEAARSAAASSKSKKATQQNHRSTSTGATAPHVPAATGVGTATRRGIAPPLSVVGGTSLWNVTGGASNSKPGNGGNDATAESTSASTAIPVMTGAPSTRDVLALPTNKTESLAIDAVVPPVLSNINLTVQRGQLVAVIGPVGSGKTALCAAILGELSKAEGDVAVSGRVAYVPQTAWVLNATLRRNITFAAEAAAGGASLPPEQYEAVLDACQLRPDLAVLPAGAETEVGERGITLSGGQKQRVSVARAAATNADIVILDDPLSALDAEVGKALFNACILGTMARSTRLLVTNQLQYLKYCDAVVVLGRRPDGSGGVIAHGSYADLLRTNVEFAELLSSYGAEGNAAHDVSAGSSCVAQSSTKSDSVAESRDDPGRALCDDARKTGESSTSDSKSGATDVVVGGSELCTQREHKLTAHEAKQSAQSPIVEIAADVKTASVTSTTAVLTGAPLMSIEEREHGAVPLKLWIAYFRYSGSVIGTLSVLFIAYTLNQFATLASTWWVAYWSADLAYIAQPIGFYCGIFAAIGVAAALFSFIRVIVQLFASIRSSRALHAALLKSILAAPLSFYDTTPLGRILQRFSKDADAIDNQLPSSIGFLGMCIWMVAGGFAAIIFATPWFALTLPFIVLGYLRIMTYFRNLARETKRFDSTTRSPIYAHFSESLGGLSVIRAYGLSAEFAAANEAHIARNLSAWYTLKSCDRWLSVRLENVGNLVVLAAAMLAVGTASAHTGGTTSGLAGFSLSFAMSVTSLFNFLVRSFSDAEQQMVSVERVEAYSKGLAQEPYDAPLGAPALPNGWPLSSPSASGAPISFDNYTMRYRLNTPDVLRGVTFKIRSGERIGVVGRTGSGKSSLLAALFRLTPLECHTGTITLADANIDNVGIRQLRAQLAIIPQDPVIFSGTLRSNLDPMAELHSAVGKSGLGQPDEALWAVLETVGLRGVIATLPGGLDAPVSENGENFSTGTRQLICLARVLLHRCAVLLLDEASSSLDHMSDVALQGAIRSAFGGKSTVVTIAHRLNTIIDSDRILVMDGGKVAEFASPYELLQNANSLFTALIEELGPETAASMRVQAAQAFMASAANPGTSGQGGRQA